MHPIIGHAGLRQTTCCPVKDFYIVKKALAGQNVAQSMDKKRRVIQEGGNSNLYKPTATTVGMQRKTRNT